MWRARLVTGLTGAQGFRPVCRAVCAVRGFYGEEMAPEDGVRSGDAYWTHVDRMGEAQSGRKERSKSVERLRRDSLDLEAQVLGSWAKLALRGITIGRVITYCTPPKLTRRKVGRLDVV